MARAWFVFLFAAAAAAQPGGKALFQKNCAVCHQASGENRAPLPDALAQLPQQAIVAALETGSMKTQGASLTPAQRVAIARFLSSDTGAKANTAASNLCPANPPIVGIAGWNGWGVDLVNSRYQPANAAGMTGADIPHLKLAWAFGFPGALTISAQPTIAGGRLFLGSHDGTVYSLDAKTGCVYWTFKASTAVRSPIALASTSNGYTAFFGDGQANAYAVSAQTGDLLWKVKVDEHKMAGITGGPRFYQGRLYVPVRSGIEEMMAGNPKYGCC